MTNSTQFMWGFYNKLLNKDPYISLLITTRISWRCLFVAHLAHLALGKHPAFQPAHGFPPRRSRRHSFDRCGDPYSTLGEKGVTSIAGGYPDVFQLALTEVLPSTFFQIWKLRSLFFFSKQGPFERTKRKSHHHPKTKSNHFLGFSLGHLCPTLFPYFRCRLRFKETNAICMPWSTALSSYTCTPPIGTRFLCTSEDEFSN